MSGRVRTSIVQPVNSSGKCGHGKYSKNHLSGKAKKKLNCFSGHSFKKTDAAGRVFILIIIQQKTDAGTFFSKFRTIFFKSCACTAISADIIQDRPF